MDDKILRGLSVLVAEDEYMLAVELRSYLADMGASVAGPVGNLRGLMELIDKGFPIDGAILDVNLQGEKVFEAAEKLEKIGVPFIFTTGYDAAAIPARFREVQRFGKPTGMSKLAHAIRQITADRDTR